MADEGKEIPADTDHQNELQKANRKKYRDLSAKKASRVTQVIIRSLVPRSFSLMILPASGTQ